MTPDELRLLIDDGEGEKIEFKRELHVSRQDKAARAEAVRDLIAMGNTHGERPGYILIGVANDQSVHPLAESFDSAQLEQHFNELIDPRIDFKYSEVLLSEGRVGVIEVPYSSHRFHMVRQDWETANADHRCRLFRGQSWIRHNTSKRFPTPLDMQRMKEAHCKANQLAPRVVVSFDGEESIAVSAPAGLVPYEDNPVKSAAHMARAAQGWFAERKPGEIVLSFAVENVGNQGANDITVFINPQSFIHAIGLREPSLPFTGASHRTRVNDGGVEFRRDKLTHGLSVDTKEVVFTIDLDNIQDEYTLCWDAHAANMESAQSGTLKVILNR